MAAALEPPAPSDGPVLALLGPTASGKSSLALRIAAAWRNAGRPLELVSVDAFTVYRGMDVGTAKPDPVSRAQVRHHLIDVLDPGEELTVVRFRDLAREAIGEVHGRGATALLVGGSGLYWRAVVDDLAFPPTDPVVRRTVEERHGGEVLSAHAELVERDPVAAERIDGRNLRRIIRALEVIDLTGRRFSEWDDAWRRHDSVYERLDVAFLDPPNPHLRAAIDDRARRMVEEGLLAEVEQLRERPRSRTAIAAIGYAEAEAVLEGRMPAAELPAAIADRTWRYARRQRSWFRSDPRCVATEPEEILSRWAAA